MDGLAAFQQNSTGLFRELPAYLPLARFWQEDGLFVGISGWNLSAFNNAFILDERQVSPQQLERPREIFAQGNLPFSVIVYSQQAVPACDALLKAHDYFDIFTDQVMIREDPSLLSQHAAPAVDIRVVTSPQERADFLDVVVNAFDLPPSMPIELFSDLLRVPLFHPMIAYMNNIPVGSGMLLYCQGIAAVYNVGTVTTMRNRGVGTAMVKALHLRACQGGYQGTVLASTPSGYSLYQHLGYRLGGYQITYSPVEYLNGP